jgi:hypothetical protein
MGEATERVEPNADIARGEDNSKETLLSATRCAELLFVLAFLLFLATLALNRALADNRLEYERRYDHYEDSGSMLGRVRLLRARTPPLFEALALASLTGWPPREPLKATKIARLVANGPFHISRRSIDGALYAYHSPVDGQLFSDLARSSEAFGVEAAQIIAEEKTVEGRQSRLINAVIRTVTNIEAQQYLTKSPVSLLAHIDEPGEWTRYTNAAWIVQGEWPPIGGSSGSTGPGTTYLNRFLVPSDADSREFFLYQVVAGHSPDLSFIENEIEGVWRAAYARWQETPTIDPAIGVPTAGASLRATDIVMLGGPVLTLVYGFFAMFWLRYWATSSLRGTGITPYVFPIYGGPIDPTTASRPRTLIDILERAVWLAFLLLPIIVLSFAILTRYDVGVFSSRGPSAALPWVARLMSERNHSDTSKFLDAMNVASLLLALIVLGRIAAIGSTWSASETVSRAARSFAPWVVSFWSVAVAASCFIDESRSRTALWEIVPSDWAYLFSCGLAWTSAAVIAVAYRRRFALAISASGLFLFLASFVPTIGR